jgi:Tfp pilus assembly protein PilN
MIQINLLPGAKKVRGTGLAGAAGALGSYLAAVTARVRDPFLAAAVGSVVAAVLFVGGTHLAQSARERAVAERQEQATADSARYAVILRERTSAVAQRDSVSRQLQIIRTIDNNRFIWPHVMDEVSRALPPYTWLTAMEQTSAPVLAVHPVGADSAKKAPVAGTPAADSAPSTALRMRIVGNTVDIQALTRFMKDLEASPFVRNVTLNKSDLVIVDGKEVTQFQLDCEYQAPDPAAIRTVPVSLEVR